MFQETGDNGKQSVHDEIYVGCNLSSGGFCLCLTLAYGGMKGRLWLWLWPRTQWALKYNTYTLLYVYPNPRREKRRFLGIFPVAFFFFSYIK